MIELVTLAQERADRPDAVRGERHKWTYFTCVACHRRCRRPRGAGQPAPKCYRPDCPLETQRWPIHFAIARARAEGRDDLADWLETLLNAPDILGGSATFYQPEPRPAPTDEDDEDYAAAARAAIERL